MPPGSWPPGQGPQRLFHSTLVEHRRELAEAAELLQPLHRVGHFQMHLEQLVDLLDGGPAALGDADLALGVDDVGLGRSLAVIELIIASSRVSAFSSTLAAPFMPFMPGSMLASAPRPPMRCIWLIWRRKSSRSNLPFSILRASFGILDLDRFGGPLDQRHDVAHAEDAAGNAGWMNSGASIASPVPANLIGLPVTARIEAPRRRGHRRPCASG